ncbi:hypothetical protein [Streptomyces sp. CRN 30]|uniref:Rv1733c family protein n=1 Tax=Streptomyces sp. CRN 30 TaxID=3075613 RepID=UPI002A80F7EB|nr:hypothetical protein [Streptomyces sp. CRN 30]
MRAIRGLWRWRHNPLRRTTDLAEAWVALVALLLIVCVAPVVGVVAGAAAEDALQRSVHDQREARHRVTATVVRELDRSAPAVDPEAASAGDLRSRVLAEWTAPDGSARHGPVLAGLDTPRPGDRFGMWTDDHGRTVGRPLDAATAATHAVLAGIGAGLLTAALAEGARRVVVWRLVRRRYALLDQAWDRTGPDWGRTGTGS